MTTAIIATEATAAQATVDVQATEVPEVTEAPAVTLDIRNYVGLSVKDYHVYLRNCRVKFSWSNKGNAQAILSIPTDAVNAGFLAGYTNLLTKKYQTKHYVCKPSKAFTDVVIMLDNYHQASYLLDKCTHSTYARGQYPSAVTEMTSQVMAAIADEHKSNPTRARAPYTRVLPTCNPTV